MRIEAGQGKYWGGFGGKEEAGSEGSGISSHCILSSFCFFCFFSIAFLLFIVMKLFVIVFMWWY